MSLGANFCLTLDHRVSTFRGPFSLKQENRSVFNLDGMVHIKDLLAHLITKHIQA